MHSFRHHRELRVVLRVAVDVLRFRVAARIWSAVTSLFVFLVFMYVYKYACMYACIYKSVYVCVYVFIYIIHRVCFWWIVLRPYLETSPATSTWREQKPDILWYAESNVSEVEIHREDTGMLYSTCITLSTFAMMLVCNKAKTAAGWSRAGLFGALGSYSAILWATIKYTVYCVQLL